MVALRFLGCGVDVDAESRGTRVGDGAGNRCGERCSAVVRRVRMRCAGGRLHTGPRPPSLLRAGGGGIPRGGVAGEGLVEG
jgi:hypothetical protein